MATAKHDNDRDHPSHNPPPARIEGEEAHTKDAPPVSDVRPIGDIQYEQSQANEAKRVADAEGAAKSKAPPPPEPKTEDHSKSHKA